MDQTSLNRAVALATGETVDRIQKIGFSLIVVAAIPRSAGNDSLRQPSRPSVQLSLAPERRRSEKFARCQ